MMANVCGAKNKDRAAEVNAAPRGGEGASASEDRSRAEGAVSGARKIDVPASAKDRERSRAPTPISCHPSSRGGSGSGGGGLRRGDGGAMSSLLLPALSEAQPSIDTNDSLTTTGAGVSTVTSMSTPSSSSRQYHHRNHHRHGGSGGCPNSAPAPPMGTTISSRRGRARSPVSVSRTSPSSGGGGGSGEIGTFLRKVDAVGGLQSGGGGGGGGGDGPSPSMYGGGLSMGGPLSLRADDRRDDGMSPARPSSAAEAAANAAAAALGGAGVGGNFAYSPFPGDRGGGMGGTKRKREYGGSGHSDGDIGGGDGGGGGGGGSGYRPYPPGGDRHDRHHSALYERSGEREGRSRGGYEGPSSRGGGNNGPHPGRRDSFGPASVEGGRYGTGGSAEDDRRRYGRGGLLDVHSPGRPAGGRGVGGGRSARSMTRPQHRPRRSDSSVSDYEASMVTASSTGTPPESNGGTSPARGGTGIASARGVSSSATSASFVFRRAPPPTSSAPSGGGRGEEYFKSSPTQIMALQMIDSSGGSFDNDRLGGSDVGEPGPSPSQALSPLGPPQIQHAHLQYRLSPNTFFDTSPSKTDGMSPMPHRSSVGGAQDVNGGASGGHLDMSFSLLNHSFDSIGDNPSYAMAGMSLPNLEVNAGSFGGAALHGPAPSELQSPGGKIRRSDQHAHHHMHRSMSSSNQSPRSQAHPRLPLDRQDDLSVHSDDALGPLPFLDQSNSESHGERAGGLIQPLGSISPGHSLGDYHSRDVPSAIGDGLIIEDGTGGRNAAMCDPRRRDDVYQGTPKRVDGPAVMGGSRGGVPIRPGTGSRPMAASGAAEPAAAGDHCLEHIHRAPSGGAQRVPSRPAGSHRMARRAPSPTTSRGGLSGPSSTPSFYAVLRRWRKAFDDFTFLLPGVKTRETCSVNISSLGGFTVTGGGSGVGGRTARDSIRGYPSRGEEHYGRGESQKDAFMPEPSTTPQRPKTGQDPSVSELTLAKRRIASAVCAFGGSGHKPSSPSIAPSRSGVGSSSIFRTKYESDGNVVASSRIKSEAEVKYEELLPTRYYENENRLSWEVEEKPPVEVVSDDEDGNESDRTSSKYEEGDKKIASSKKAEKSEKDGELIDMPSSSDPLFMNEEHCNKYSRTAPSPTPSTAASIVSASGEPPKMKYRCKLCGQPKQNHTCPYQQSLQRSIGIMVYPAVNAFAAGEPGTLAPALTDMNNFTNLENESAAPDRSPSRCHIEHSKRRILPNVTPETLRSVGDPENFSPGSSLSGGTGTPHGTPFRRSAASTATPPTLALSPTKRMRRGDGSGLRGFGYDLSADPVFLESMELKPEQYRIVSIRTTEISSRSGAFSYPPLPLPYEQRKRLSDSLFTMSKEVDGLTDECAVVLREARQKGMWDLAVAELLTQVVVVVHCRDTDTCLEGLRRYLITLGIAC